MDKMGFAQVHPVMRKEKKKQVKDEVDRHKQAEKKRRRLEKALATSAAIRSELEKKKQKKKEEQQRLDEEGAAIAEAVALHVLLGEDSDDSCKVVLKDQESFNPCNCGSNIGIFRDGWKTGLPPQGPTRLEWVSQAYKSDCAWNDWGIGGWSLSPSVYGKDFRTPYFKDRDRESMEISVGTIAAQAVSSLHIAEDVCADAIIVNGMLESKLNSFSNQVQSL